jgi:hypothetical protein
MAEDSSLSTMNVSGIKRPNYTWKCQLHPGTWWMVEEGREPNWFHRKMQEICFGVKWIKIDD